MRIRVIDALERRRVIFLRLFDAVRR